MKERLFAKKGQLAYKNGPYAVDFHEGRMFVSSNGNEKFCEADPETGDIIKDFTVIGVHNTAGSRQIPAYAATPCSSRTGQQKGPVSMPSL